MGGSMRCLMGRSMRCLMERSMRCLMERSMRCFDGMFDETLDRIVDAFDGISDGRFD